MANDLQISNSETNTILEQLRSVAAVPGDVVEFGCYAGDTSVKLAEVIQNTDKWLWLYDSFEGLPEKTAADQSSLGRWFKAGELKVSIETVAHKFKKYSLSDPVIKKGWFNELKPEDLPDQISFALLDGDYYESIKDSFRLILPKLNAGAIIIVHDYRNPALPGSAKAVNEFLDAHPDFGFKIINNLAIIEVK